LESGIRDEGKFYKLFTLMAEYSGMIVNHNELSNSLKISIPTVEHYIYTLRKCFHIQMVNPYYNNLRKELVKMKKYYLQDTGLRNIIINNFQPLHERLDKGSLLENFVYMQMRQELDSDEIKYWRTADQQEIDFILPIQKKAIEIKFSESENKITKYKKFRENYPEFLFDFLNWNTHALLCQTYFESLTNYSVSPT
jgi:hypothetical protein